MKQIELAQDRVQSQAFVMMLIVMNLQVPY
jgi:hypothetical protein